MIASGKSTYSSNAAKEGWLVINDDAIVNMVHADDYTLYDKGLKLLYKNVEHAILFTGLSLGRNVLVDRGVGISLAGRKRYLALAAALDTEIECVTIASEGAETHALRRFQTDNRGHSLDYWLKVAKYHESIWADPTLEEGFSRIHHISWDFISKGGLV